MYFLNVLVKHSCLSHSQNTSIMSLKSCIQHDSASYRFWIAYLFKNSPIHGFLIQHNTSSKHDIPRMFMGEPLLNGGVWGIMGEPIPGTGGVILPRGTTWAGDILPSREFLESGLIPAGNWGGCVKGDNQITFYNQATSFLNLSNYQSKRYFEMVSES